MSVETLISRLSAQVFKRFAANRLACPAQMHLERLFQVLYFASLRTEETNPVRLHIVLLDPARPDPAPPRYPPSDRWTFVQLHEKIEFTTSNIAKIASGSDPRASAVAVHVDGRGKIWVWGLIDQQNRFFDYIHHDTDVGPERPGVLQALITGIGHIVVYYDYEKLAELRRDALAEKPVAIFSSGVIHGILRPHAEQHVDRIKATLRRTPGYSVNRRQTLIRYVEESRAALIEDWFATIIRLLLRIERLRHGGAVLLTGGPGFAGLKRKYRIRYPRLRNGLVHLATTEIVRQEAWHTIFRRYIDRDKSDVPARLYLDESVSQNTVDDVRSEIDGCVWFVALLSRVDGLVLMRPDLNVKAFGVEITTSQAPKSIHMVRAASGSLATARILNYEHFGTRHRSMMRYCGANPGAVGFVISQDGGIRAMTGSSKGHVLVWENVKLQLEFPSFELSQKTRVLGAVSSADGPRLPPN